MESLTVPPDAALGLWAKSNAAGKPHSLIGHLLDTAAIAELLWDEFLSTHTKTWVDESSDGHGRDLFVMLAGLHDAGKATPNFQVKATPPGAEETLARQLVEQQPLATPTGTGDRWPHGRAGALILHEALTQRNVTGHEWLRPLVEGHHGWFAGAPIKPGQAGRRSHRPPWPAVQHSVVAQVLDQAGIDPTGWRLSAPSRGQQLALAGFITMADWIASSEDHFPGLGLGTPPSMEQARDRAEKAWADLGLTGGWRDERPPATFRRRFGFSPRPLQELASRAALEMSKPGLMIIEAPMGEGKTEAALFAVEVLANRFGASGLLFAMPTQGTTDAMYTRVTAWAETVDERVPVSLLHGKAMLNEAWRDRLEGHAVTGICDEFGMADEYGIAAEHPAATPARWVLGRHRGLLSPIAVTTVDQLLWAATRTKYVSLRHAGLAGKVVIIDEVHAYDVYMQVFLHELLRWCARAQVPVILMSATLAPSLRAGLLGAWHDGTGAQAPVPEISGYPSIVVTQTDQPPLAFSGDPFRADRKVVIDIHGADVDDTAAIAHSLAEEVRDGGCALAILNTVRRAQEVYSAIRAQGLDALLIHGRLTAKARADRTARAIAALGTPENRPHRFIVVATQIAEQSFDADADVLFSDLAPVDLLAQRIGRLHRHAANDALRPQRHKQPRAIITGAHIDGDSARWNQAFTHVYGDWVLWKASAALHTDTAWKVPSGIPRLVEQAYGSDWDGPNEWRTAAASALAEQEAEAKERQSNAKSHRLDSETSIAHPTLEYLHLHGTHDTEEGCRAVVRDGEPTVEVTLIRQVVPHENCYETLSGRSLGPEGSRISDPRIAREVLGDSVRLDERRAKDVTPLPQWASSPLLGNHRVLILDSDNRARLGRHVVMYDEDLGLQW